jgi:hypothetical protein
MRTPNGPTRSDWDETRATARLPNLDIEVLHRRSWVGDAEQLQVTLTGVPSLEAASRMLEAANPMLFWMRMAEAAWAPWLALMAPARTGLPKGD